MSRPVRERLMELSADVDRVRLAPAAAVRARGRRRTRRRRATTAAALATVVVAGGFGLTSVVGGGPDPVATLPAAPSSSCRFPVDLTLPGAPGDVVVEVVGGSEQAGQVAGELGNRGFQASGQGWIDPDSDARGQVAVLRYGPQAIGAATVVRAVVNGAVVMRFVPDREGRTVELVLGSDFDRLATTTEVNRNLAEYGAPTRPPGC